MTLPLKHAIVIRTAQSTDAVAIAELAEELGYPSRLDQIQDRLRLLLEKKGNWVAVAEAGGSVVGWIHLFAAYRLESPPFAEIGGLIVSEADRGRGIGRRLIEAAAQWAADHGFTELRVRSNVTRSETHRFYDHLGFASTKTQTVFAKRIK